MSSTSGGEIAHEFDLGRSRRGRLLTCAHLESPASPLDLKAKRSLRQLPSQYICRPRYKASDKLSLEIMRPHENCDRRACGVLVLKGQKATPFTRANNHSPELKEGLADSLGPLADKPLKLWSGFWSCLIDRKISAILAHRPRRQIEMVD